MKQFPKLAALVMHAFKRCFVGTVFSHRRYVSKLVKIPNSYMINVNNKLLIISITAFLHLQLSHIFYALQCIFKSLLGLANL